MWLLAGLKMVASCFCATAQRNHTCTAANKNDMRCLQLDANLEARFIRSCTVRQPTSDNFHQISPAVLIGFTAAGSQLALTSVAVQSSEEQINSDLNPEGPSRSLRMTGCRSKKGRQDTGLNFCRYMLLAEKHPVLTGPLK